jgi:hypothetical protein
MPSPANPFDSRPSMSSLAYSSEQQTATATWSYPGQLASNWNDDDDDADDLGSPSTFQNTSRPAKSRKLDRSPPRFQSPTLQHEEGSVAWPAEQPLMSEEDSIGNSCKDECRDDAVSAAQHHWACSPSLDCDLSSMQAGNTYLSHASSQFGKQRNSPSPSVAHEAADRNNPNSPGPASPATVLQGYSDFSGQPAYEEGLQQPPYQEGQQQLLVRPVSAQTRPQRNPFWQLHGYDLDGRTVCVQVRFLMPACALLQRRCCVIVLCFPTVTGL